MINLQNILEGCRQHDRRDQKVLYQKYYAFCLKVVFRYIFRYDKATDVVNDGFVKVFGKLNTFVVPPERNTEAVFMGWLKVIMINTAIDRLRQDHFIPETQLTDEGIWIEDTSQHADHSVLYKELIMQVQKLPLNYRMVFNMFVIDGFTHPEIAGRLGIAVGTSKSNLFKAKGLLKNYIKKNEFQIQPCKV